MSEIDSKYKIKVTKGEEEADIYQEFEINIYTLIHPLQAESLLTEPLGKPNIHTTIYKLDNQQGPTVYSTGNSTQYLAIAYDGKESEKKFSDPVIYVYN